MSNRPRAVLVLADGTVFHGDSIGAEGLAAGEVIFNTAMVGYQEILTDPSYCRQIVTLTYPHVGNTGVNDEDTESTLASRAIHATGLVIRDLSLVASNWRHRQSLPDFLKQHGTLAISGIDTRKLTRILRENGTQAGCIMAGRINEAEALQQAQAFPGLTGVDLVHEVSCQQSWRFNESERTSETGLRIAVLDFGVRRSILAKLVALGCHVAVYPAWTNSEEILASRPDGIVLSNGPGDPQACDYAVTTTRTLLKSGVPVFGFCLGHQLIALAIGAKIIKMKTGHHGANHPVLDVDSGRVMITDQNHGFVVDAETLPANTRVTHYSLFDESLQGFELTDHSVFCFQGYPEVGSGSQDADYLFHRFIRQVAENKQSI